MLQVLQHAGIGAGCGVEGVERTSVNHLVSPLLILLQVGVGGDKVGVGGNKLVVLGDKVPILGDEVGIR